MTKIINSMLIGGASWIEPILFDWLYGYCEGKDWVPENSVTNRTDVYELEANMHYLLCFGPVVGTRRRTGIFATNPVTATAKVNAVTSIQTARTPPSPYEAYLFTTSTADSNYLVVTKDNASTDGIKTYLAKLETLVDELM